MSSLSLASLPLLAAVAHASPNYPATLEVEADMPCTPPCTVCHETLLGGQGTVVRAFGSALVERGLTGGSDVARLVAVLAEARAEEQDVAADGVPDLDRLAAGVDPNPGGEAICDVLIPSYGCFAHTPRAPASLAVLLATLAVLGTGRRARLSRRGR